MYGRRIVAAVVLVVGGVLVVWAAPAAANHTVDWGAGRACGETAKTATTTVNTPVPFTVCVTLGGDPLAGHQMTVRVVGPTRSAETGITTGDDGIAKLSVQPTSEGTTTVTLCDADGCVYGDTVITVTPAPTTTTAPPAAGVTTTTAPLAATATTTTTTTTAAPPAAVVTTATTTAVAPTTTTTPTATTPTSAAGDGIPWWLIPGLLLLLLIVAGLVVLLRRRFGATPVAMVPAPAPDPVYVEGAPPPIHARPPPADGAIRPIIFVPGIMASALMVRAADNTLQQVWPPLGFDGDVRRCLESLTAGRRSQFEIDTATGDGLLDGIHEGLIRTLIGHGYRNVQPKPNLYVYPYNWMEPCATAGAGLKALIDRANADWGVPPGVIVHSMGGLVLRAAWHLHGARAIDKVMYIGSPHLGASMAYYVLHPRIPYSFLGGTPGDILNVAYAMSITARKRNRPASNLEEVVEFVTDYVAAPPLFDDALKLVAQNATGVFELLPDALYFEHVNPRWPVARRVGATTTATFRDAQHLPDMEWIGDGRSSPEVPQPVRYTRIPRTWPELYLTDEDLKLDEGLHEKVRQAMAFKDRIARPLPPEDGARTMIIHGATQPTSSTADYSVVDGTVRVDLSGAQGGDGTVPTESGRGQPLWAGAPTVVVENGSEHFRLTELDAVHQRVRQFFPNGGMP